MGSLYKTVRTSYIAAMADSRDRQYAELLVDTCLGVQPGWQVVIGGSPPGRPLIDEIVRVVAERDAYPLLRLTFDDSTFVPRTWTRLASLERLATLAPIDAHAIENCDALIVVLSPENTRDASSVDSERMAALQGAYRPALERVFAGQVPWVGCQYPTPALAQEAGMATEEFADFLY